MESIPGLGSGDSFLLKNILPEEWCSLDSFESLLQEIEWKEQINRGGKVPRLLSYQGAIGEYGEIPIYRVPTDELFQTKPFTHTIIKIKEFIEYSTKQSFNHCLIQLYRSGYDFISEHSDKTLDIFRHSNIVNLSIGAERNMKLYSKSNKKETQCILLPHNSLFCLGWDTNINYLHAIRPDKRPDSIKSPEELRYGSRRISLTFRNIATYLHPNGYVFGQGAYCKSLDNLSNALKSDSYETLRASEAEQSELMLKAFSTENHSCEFNWDDNYGRGFDIVQISPS
jgi:alkylated DNA repair dioxygenase AlkB